MAEDIASAPDAAAPHTAALHDGLTAQCSARRCRTTAAFQLRWNNPKLHTAEARKTWLACPEHRDSLSAFLQARRFLREVEPFPPAGPKPPATAEPGPNATSIPEPNATAGPESGAPAARATGAGTA